MGKTDEEIRDILKSKSRLTLNGQIKEFSGEQLNTDEFQSYIKGEKNDTSKPRSVKRIEIESAKLKSMENAIIYDVPGFDSPTQLHMRQTEERLKSADVIILVTNVGRNPSIQGTSLNVITKNTDADGIALKDKLFVFGNQIDLVNRKEDISGNRNILVNDVKKYHIGEEKRVFIGSAYKYLVAEKNIIPDNEYQCKYDISSGVDEIRQALVHYYETERFEILKRKIDSNKTALKKLFAEMQNNNANNMEYSEDSEYQKSVIFREESKAIEQRIQSSLKQFTHNKKEEIYRDKWLSNELKAIIQSGNVFPQIGEVEFEKTYIESDESIRLDTPYEKINTAIRSRLHLKFLEGYIDLIKSITNKNCSDTELEMLQTFTNAVAGNTHYSEHIKNLCERFIKNITVDVAHNDQRFTYLIERFSRLVFDIIIEFPIGNSDRIERFNKNQADVLMLDHYYSNNKGRLANEMLNQSSSTQLSSHLEKIDNEWLKTLATLAMNSTPLTQVKNTYNLATMITGIKSPNHLVGEKAEKRANSKESVIKEINKDIDNLVNVLVEAVIPAIDLEMAFMNGVDKQVKLILASSEGNNKFSRQFNEFVSSIILETKKNELENISKVIELQKVKREILASIQDFSN